MRASVVPVGRWALLCAMLVSSGARAQETGPGSASALDPDSVHVGEPFTLGLTITLAAPGEVRFPAVLPVDDPLEQRGPVSIRSDGEGREWRAYYPLAAWRTGSHPLPAVEASLETPERTSRPLTVRGPTVHVVSLIPAAMDDPQLRDARPYLRARTFPWWLLALLGAVALAAWWWRRRAASPVAAGASPVPGSLALAELARLREAWRAGRLTGEQLYDGFEGAVRRYVAGTRGWAPGRALLALGPDAGPLWRALHDSLLVRFARLRERETGPDSALDAGEAWVRADMTSAPDGPDEAEEGP